MKRNETNELIYEIQADLENKYMVVRRGVASEGKRAREFGTDMYTLLYFKWITRVYCIAQGTLRNVMRQPG